MYISPYDTTACRPLYKLISKTVTAIAEDNVKGNLITNKASGSLRYDSKVKLPNGVRVFVGYNGAEQLFHPIPLDRDELGIVDSFVAIDGRPFAMPNNAKSGVFTPKNEDTWMFQVVTAGITRLLQEGDRSGLDALIQPTAKVFANWLRTAITRKFKVPEHLHETVEGIVALYCYSMFRSSSMSLSKEAKEMWAIRLQREFRFRNPDTAISVVEKITPMESIADLAENIKKICDTPALESMNSLTLLQAAYTGWDPLTGTYILSASLEHLPTLMAIIYISQRQSYSRLPLSKTVMMLLAKNHTEYVQRIDRLLFF